MLSFIFTVSCLRRPFCNSAWRRGTTKFGIVIVFSPPQLGVSQPSLDFLPCRATSSDERREAGKKVEEGKAAVFPLSVSFFNVSLTHCSCLSCQDNNRSLKTREHERSGRGEEKKHNFLDKDFLLDPLGGVDTGHRGTGTLCSVCVCPCVSVYPSLFH